MCIHVWSDEGETCVSGESTNKVDNSTLAVDCSDEEFGKKEASLYTKYCTDRTVPKHGTRS